MTYLHLLHQMTRLLPEHLKVYCIPKMWQRVKQLIAWYCPIVRQDQLTAIEFNHWIWSCLWMTLKMMTNKTTDKMSNDPSLIWVSLLLLISVIVISYKLNESKNKICAQELLPPDWLFWRGENHHSRRKHSIYQITWQKRGLVHLSSSSTATSLCFQTYH